MKDKRHSLSLVGLVLILVASVVACNQPVETKPIAIQPTPRTLTGTGPNFIIPLKVGERVEIEVAHIDKTKTIGIVAITDPYGNKIAQSATKLADISLAGVPFNQRTGSHLIVIHETSIQSWPWHYAFIAATDGDYMVQSPRFTPNLLANAAIKAVIYP